MIHLTSSTLIELPVQQVFDFVSTPENNFQWQAGTLATARLSKGSHAIMTFFRSIGHLMGRRNLSTFEITEFQPNVKFGFKSLSGPVHSRTSYTLEKESDRTRLHISVQASAPNFFHITEKLLWKTMKNNSTKIWRDSKPFSRRIRQLSRRSRITSHRKSEPVVIETRLPGSWRGIG